MIIFIILILLLVIVFGRRRADDNRKRVGLKFAIAVTIIILAIKAIVSSPEPTREQAAETTRVAAEKKQLADEKELAEAIASYPEVRYAQEEEVATEEQNKIMKDLIEGFKK